MVDAAIHNELTNFLGRLPVSQQRQVLEFARTLVAAPPRGVPGADLLRFAGTIEADDLDKMTQAIEEGCERVDADEW